MLQIQLKLRSSYPFPLSAYQESLKPDLLFQEELEAVTQPGLPQKDGAKVHAL